MGTAWPCGLVSDGRCPHLIRGGDSVCGQRRYGLCHACGRSRHAHDTFAERMRFPAFLLFTVLWSTLVYTPLAHWVWADGGWLRHLGTLDFAGGMVVHISAGVAGLVTAMVVGKRDGSTGQRRSCPTIFPWPSLGRPCAVVRLVWLERRQRSCRRRARGQCFHHHQCGSGRGCPS